MADTNHLWGVDLGGTKIEGVILTRDRDHEVVLRKRIATEADQGYRHILERIKLLIDTMREESGIKPSMLGIGTPGSLDPMDGIIKNSNSTNLNGQPLKKDLEALLGIKVTMANDANCFALAETVMGIVKDIEPNATVTFGVIMGTGVGGGIVVNNKVISGKQGIAGEWGHIFLDDSGGDCYCGKTGCVEKILSGPALEKFYVENGGEQLRLKQIVERYYEGHDIAATKTIERLIHFFGLGLSNIVNILDPDVIVIGGGVGNIDLLYDQGVGAIKKHVFDTNKGFHTKIAKPKLGDSAGVFGAAFLNE